MGCKPNQPSDDEMEGCEECSNKAEERGKRLD